ncbi:MAG: chemotaxis protein CheW [Gemmatimonadota bacterium]
MNDSSAAGEEYAQLLVVMAGGRTCGLPVGIVREVAEPPPVTRVPFAPPSVVGIATLRDETMPVVDLRLRLGGESAPGPAYRVVVVEVEDRGRVGLLVDGVAGLRPQPPPQDTEEVPASLAGALPEGVAWGLARFGAETVLMLDAGRLLAVDAGSARG